MRIALLLILVAGALAAEPPKAPPARADILARNPRYTKEPAREKEFVGVLREHDKGGYFLELEKGKEDLVLFPDAGDPLAPYLGQRVRIVGKQVNGPIGSSTTRHTLPGRLEVLPPEPEDTDPPDRTRQEDELERLEREIRKRQEELKKQEPLAPGAGEKKGSP